MKRKGRVLVNGVVTTLCAALLSAGLTLPIAAASTQCTAYSGSNVGAQEYVNAYRWVLPMKSFMQPLTADSYLRFQVEAVSDKYLAEYYNASNELQETKLIPEELPLFGCYYFDGSYHYVLSGQENPSESNEVEVYRLTKYDQNWNKLGSASLYGANTYIPFDGGSARMDHDENLLFIRTCHEMYADSDGVHHQANVTIEVNTQNMTVVDSFTDIMNSSYGYVSHSFNQFIKLDQGYMVGVDHGDAHPRSVALLKYKSQYTSSGFAKKCSYISMLDIPGESGDNDTGVSVGGFEISSTNYLVAGNTVPMDGEYDAFATRNIFVSAVPRNFSSSDQAVVHQITDIKEGQRAPSTPQLVKISDTDFLLLWTVGNQVQYCKINENGERVGDIYTMSGALSDCKPVVWNGNVCWYTWASEINTFYRIPISNLASPTTDRSVNGHQYDCENEEGKPVCQVCGDTPAFITMDSFALWWWTKNPSGGASGSSGFNTVQTEGSKHYVQICSASPADAENQELILTSSNPDVIAVSGYNFELVGAGTATITVAAKYNPKVKISKTITVKHATIVTDAAVEATCTKAGKTEGSHCDYCGQVVVEQETVSPLGHDATDATFVWATDGKSCQVDLACSRCDYVGKEDCIVTSTVLKEANCSQKGTTTYTATYGGISDKKELTDIPIDPDTHVKEADEAVEATCEATGLTAGTHCKLCNKVLTKQAEVPSLGHAQTEPAFAWAADGKTCEVSYGCSRCDQTWADTLTATAQVIEDATCSKLGKTKYTITYDGQKKSIELSDIAIDPENHSYVVQDVERPTCTTAGKTDGKYCNACGYVAKKQTTIPAEGHQFAKPIFTWAEDGKACKITQTCQRCDYEDENACEVTSVVSVSANCIEKGTTTYTATYGGISDKKELTDIPIDPDTHVEEADEAVEATCEATGLTAGTHCKLCNKVLTKQAEVPSLGHAQTEPAFAWAADGKTCEVSYGCSRCDQTWADTLTATAQVIEDATCSKMGKTKYTITYDGQEKAIELTDIAVAADKHVWKYDSQEEPTCTEEGLAAGKECSQCGIKSDTQEVIPPLGHSWAKPVFVWAADGKACKMTQTCQRCDYEDENACEVTSVVSVSANCIEKGTTTYTATYGGISDKKELTDIPIDPDTHVEEADEAVEATCEATGLTDGTHCKLCNKVLTKQAEVPSLGHAQTEPAFAWAADGKTCEVSYGCSRCEQAWSDTLTATAEVIEDATCSKMGKTKYTITYDGQEKAIERMDIEKDPSRHVWVTDALVPATCEKSGKTQGSHCKVCREVRISPGEIACPSNISLSKEKYTYDGVVHKPDVVITDANGMDVDPSQYQVTYDTDCKNAGTHCITIHFSGNYSGKVTKSFVIDKKAQPMKLSKSQKKVKHSSVKKRAQKFTIKVKKNQGKVTFKSYSKRVSVTQKGKVIVKKGTKKGTYKIKVTAKGNQNYKSGSKIYKIIVK